MSKVLKMSDAASTDEGTQDKAGRNMDAAEALNSELEVVRSFLQIMSDLSTAAAAQPEPQHRRVNIGAVELNLVMSDLAERCAAAGQRILDMGYDRLG